ncbi:glutamate receptor ionotropic, delta-2-like [Tachypleus tridentatus]|uniref:glutamate receptor ionotropic, delta-2-like n=1 Tax=Tachypleus tridentatus TaxID=6853 RepID=UPI003FCFCCEC
MYCTRRGIRNFVLMFIYVIVWKHFVQLASAQKFTIGVFTEHCPDDSKEVSDLKVEVESWRQGARPFGALTTSSVRCDSNIEDIFKGMCSLLQKNPTMLVLMAHLPTLKFSQFIAAELKHFPLSVCLGSSAICQLQTAFPSASHQDVVRFTSDIAVSICKECSWVNAIILVDTLHEALKIARRTVTVNNLQKNVRIFVKNLSTDQLLVERFLHQASNILIRKKKTVFIVMCDEPVTNVILNKASHLLLFNSSVAWLFFSEVVLNTMIPLQFNNQILTLRRSRAEAPQSMILDLVTQLEIRKNMTSKLTANSSTLVTPCEVELHDFEEPETPVALEEHNLTIYPEMKMDLLHVYKASHESEAREHRVAEWSSWYGVQSVCNGTSRVCEDLQGVHLNVTTIHAPPYVIVGKSANGKPLFRGYLIDVIETLSKLLNFRYTLQNVSDSSYGLFDQKTGTWDGIIGELSREESDVGLGNFNPSEERTSVVDFLSTFVEYGGIRILTVRFQRNGENVASFSGTIHWTVWLCVLLTMVVTAALISLTNWIASLYNDVNTEDKWFDSMFFVYRALLQQGLDTTPDIISSRIVFIVWWWFAVVFYACYTATLTSTFTVKEHPVHINSIYDLMNSGYLFGTRKGTYHYDYFKVSFPGLHEKLQSFPPSLALTNDEEQGVRNVLDHAFYAFIGDETALRYEMGSSCEMRLGSDVMLSSGYNIPVRKNFPFTEAFDKALLQMYEAGILNHMKGKWWPQPPDCRPSSSEYVSLNIRQVMVPFIVLLIGIGAALCCYLGEIMCIMCCRNSYWDCWKRLTFNKLSLAWQRRN